MDPRTFDALVRSLAKPASRRGALGVAVGGVLARSGGRADAGPMATATCAAKRGVGEACSRRCPCAGSLHCGAPRSAGEREACGQNRTAERVCCRRAGEACGGSCACCGELVCQEGRCAPCPSGETPCGGVCCSGGRVCAGNGVCVFACDDTTPCPCGKCFTNVSGDPARVCIAVPAYCIDDCAKCTAAGQVCYVANVCLNGHACAAVC